MSGIEIKNLTKKFGTETAVDNLALSIKQGELFALLGVNGSGKSTTLKIICGLLKKDSGTVEVNGYSVDKDISKIRSIVSVSPQESAVARKLNVIENLVFFARIGGLSKKIALKKADELIKMLGMEKIRNKRADTLSGGMERRLSIAISLISEPKVLLLDEPTLGLDVLARRELWNVIKRLKGNVTVILTTHYLEEAKSVCDRVGIISKGRLSAVGTAEEIVSLSGEKSFEDAFVKLAGEGIE